LKAELKRADLTYDGLAERLKKHGFKKTKASIANKLVRSSLTAAFFLASLRRWNWRVSRWIKFKIF
jgi:Domain of unknown function (DUF6471)